MNTDKETMKGHHDNEEVTPAGEPFSPQINPELTDIDADLMSENIDKLKADLAEMKDKFLRLYSEFDNYKKRTQRERLELLKSASEEVILDLLPVLDDFERAFKAQENNHEAVPFTEGFALIYQKMMKALEQKGLQKMVSEGVEFDAEHHDAITNIPAPNPSLKGKIVDVQECGYFLNGKIIRHAKVIVGI